MARPHMYRTEAVVLKRVDLGEADKIVTLYTPYLGKVRAVAKGVRRPLSRLGGHVELFTHSQMLLAKGRHLDIITQSQSLHSYLGMRDDLVRVAMACCAAELLDKLTEEGAGSYPIFELLLHTLDRLAAAEDPEIALRLFEIVLLGHAGYRPELHRCVGCKATVEPSGNFFSSAAGGILCPQCGPSEAAARAITPNAIKLLRLLQSGDYATAARLRLGEELRREVEGVLRGYIQFTLERELKSSAILRSLAPIPTNG